MIEDYHWQPDAAALEHSNMAAFMRRYGISGIDELLQRADAEPDWYWPAVLAFFDIRFMTPWHKVLDTSAGLEWPRWCVGGTTNVTFNCIDRHRETASWEKPAIVWVGEPGRDNEPVETWSFRRLAAETDRMASLLRARGIGAGDVVALYLPMIPHAAAAFLAIAKIGAIVMPLFSGFGPQPLIDRLRDSNARAVITADIAWRRGQAVALRDILGNAVAHTPGVHTIVVINRSGMPLERVRAREYDYPRETQTPAETIRSLAVDAETPVMLMYTSGTTGQPKGTVHTHCGVLAKNALDMGLCIDLKPEDRLLWMSDMGWIVGPKVVISSTLIGSTLIMVEGAPDWPDPIRMWRIADRYGATIVGVVPTMVRQMMRLGAESKLRELDLAELRATISVGEPWTPESWQWFFEHVCRRKRPILNYAGGTECGGAILIGSLMRPIAACAFSHPVPGSGADIVDADGEPVATGETGELVLRRPSIGMTRGLWKAPQRYLDSYWRQFPGVWVQGDFASRDAAGLWYLHGRSDDTIKIAGKRTGPAEIEAALIATGLVSDAAVVGVPDAISGSALACACIPATSPTDADDLRRQLAEQVAAALGSPYRPRHIVLVSDLPRTRNQKIMRRVVRAMLAGIPPGDLSSLANPEVIEQLQQLPETLLKT